MPDPRNANVTPVTLKLVLMWLLSVFIIGITLAVWADSLRLWEAESSAKLVGILVVFELLVYTVILLLPTDKIVPPGRTVLAALVAAGARLMMALAAAKLVAGATMPLREVWMDFYSGLWWVAVIHVGLMGIFLWLVRAALEEPRTGRRTRRERPAAEAYAPEAFDEEEPEDGVDQQERQQELLSALMERPDQPVTETVPAVLREPEPLAPRTPQPEIAYVPPIEPASTPQPEAARVPPIEPVPTPQPESAYVPPVEPAPTPQPETAYMPPIEPAPTPQPEAAHIPPIEPAPTPQPEAAHIPPTEPAPTPQPETAYMPPIEPAPTQPSEHVEVQQASTPVAPPVPTPEPPPPAPEPTPPPAVAADATPLPSWMQQRPDRDGVDAVIAPEDLPREHPEVTVPEPLPTYDEPGDTTDHFPAVDVPVPQSAASMSTEASREEPATPDVTAFDLEAEDTVFDHADPEPQTLRQAYLPVHPGVVQSRPTDAESAKAPSVASEPVAGAADVAAETALPVFEEPPDEPEDEAPVLATAPEPPTTAAPVQAPETHVPVPETPAVEAPPEPAAPAPPQEPVAPPEPVAPTPPPEPVAPTPPPPPAPPVPLQASEPVAAQPGPAEVVEEQAETRQAQPTQLRMDEQPVTAPAAVATQPGALPAALDVAIRGTVSDIAQQEPVETGASSCGRACALIGMPGLVERYGAEVLDDLELLLGAMAAATSAVGAGDPQSLVIVGDKGTLVAGVSADGSGLLVLRAEAGIKMGRLRVAAQRVKSVASQMRGAGVCPISTPDLVALQPDTEVERQTAEQLGLRAGAFGGRERMVLLMDGLACAGLVAAAGEAVFERALTAAVYAGTGVIERILVEGADGGLVVGSCGPAGEVLVAVSAEAAAKMGAANVTVTKMRDAVRGERQ